MTTYSSYYIASFVEPPVELFCRNSSAWANDVLWRTSIRKPQVCASTLGSHEQKRLDGQHLTESLYFRTPCGSHCAFHTESLLYANPVVMGWQLADPAQKGTDGCWNPIIDMKEHDCQQYYEGWAIWVEENNKGVPETPCPECETKRAAVLASIPENMSGRCKTDISWKEDAFWRKSVENPSLCYTGNPKPVPALNLGIDHLIDSLAMRTPCGSWCIYHDESRPKHAKPGSSIPPTVDKKGWLLEDPDGKGIKGCFKPIKDIRSSPCKQWYKQWTKWLDTELLTPTAAPTSAICPACDQLKLPSERYQWDDVLVKSVPVTSGNFSTICGPRFLIVGAMGCGTDTLGSLLLQHPRVKTNPCRDPKDPFCNADYFTAGITLEGKLDLWESHGLSLEFAKDPLDWQKKFTQRLPSTDGMNGVGEFTIDKSPSYFNTDMFPGIVGRAKELLPNAKVVISLCNPAERLYHEFVAGNNNNDNKTSDADSVGRQYELSLYEKHGVVMPTDFTEFVNMLKPLSKVCIKKPQFCEELKRFKLHTGEYHAHVRKWRAEFGHEQVLVLNMEDTIRQKAKKMVDFGDSCTPPEEYPWGIFRRLSSGRFFDETYTDSGIGYSDHAEAMKWLYDYYADHNHALAQELNLDWPLLWNRMPN